MKNRNRCGRRSCSGAALLEVLLASGLLVLFANGAMLMSNQTSRVYRTETAVSKTDSQARRALSELARRLRAADGDSITVVDDPGVQRGIDFSRGLGWDPVAAAISAPSLERIVFQYTAADPDDGRDNDGDGLVDEGRVVWVEDPLAAVPRFKVLCNDVPEDGFALAWADDRITISLTLERFDPFGNPIDHTLQRAVAMRNTPVEDVQ